MLQRDRFHAHSRLRRKRGRGLAVIAALAVGVVAVVLVVLAMVSWARPRLAWRFDPATNDVTLHLRPGHGPLAAFVLAHSVLTAKDGSAVASARGHGSARLGPFRAGRTARISVHVPGLAGLTHHISLSVPPAPTVTNTATSPTRVTFWLSGPVHLARPDGRGAAHLRRVAPAVVRLDKGVRPRRVTAEVTASSGERARLTFRAPALAEAGLYDFGPAAGGRIYLTIDDGWTPSARVLALVRRTHLPITVFLIKQAALQHPAYWREIAAAGAAIEDHTVSHPLLTSLSLRQAQRQWAGARAAFASWYGRAPWAGRPPYGGVDARVRAAAALAGLRALFGWSAVVNPPGIGRPGLHTYDHGPLRAGEIVLLHWDPGLYRQLTSLLAIIKKSHLTPAFLAPANFPAPAVPGPGLTG